MGLFYKKDGSNECVGYSDADLAGETDDCNQRQGICSRSVVQ